MEYFTSIFQEDKPIALYTPPTSTPAYDLAMLVIVVPIVSLWMLYFPRTSKTISSFSGPIFALLWVSTWCAAVQYIFMHGIIPVLPDSRPMQLAYIVLFLTVMLEIIRFSCRIYDFIGFEFTERIPTEKHYTAPIGPYQRTQFDVCHAVTVCHYISVMTMFSGMTENDLELFKLGLIANMAYEVYHTIRLAYEYFIQKTAQKKVFMLTVFHHACGLSTTLSVCALPSLDPRFVMVIYELLLSGLTGVLTITIAPTFDKSDAKHLYTLTSFLAVRVAFFFKTRFGSVIYNVFSLFRDGAFQGSLVYYVCFGAFAITVFNVLIGTFMTKKLVKLAKNYNKMIHS